LKDEGMLDERLAYRAAVDGGGIYDRTIGDALRLAAQAWPTQMALIEGIESETRRSWTFAELLTDAEQVGRALLSLYSPGDHVAIWAPNSPEWVLVEFGAALAGLTLVSINPAYLAAELGDVLRRSRARGVIVGSQFKGRDMAAAAEEVAELVPSLTDIVRVASWQEFLERADVRYPLPEVSAEQVAQIQYTSGTTGIPKGARLTHRNLTNNARLYATTIGAGANDIWVNPMPLFHTAGCGLATLGALQSGGCQVLPPAFEPGAILELIERERATMMLCVPTMLGRLMDHRDIGRRNLRSWRTVTLGGAPVAPELVKRAQQRDMQVSIGYGQTEASPYITHTLPDDPHPDWVSTVGRPLPHTELKIIGVEDGATLPIDTVGEICVRGYCVMKDYYEDLEATNSAIDGDGWLHTGDLGSLDEWGYCRVQGRSKDLIIRGGENIYPREIEDVLYQHPMIVDAVVVGVPEADWGEVPVGFVILRDGQRTTGAELEEFCRSKLASFKVPRRWIFVDHLPQTASGKVQKFALQKMYVDGAFADTIPKESSGESRLRSNGG